MNKFKISWNIIALELLLIALVFISGYVGYNLENIVSPKVTSNTYNENCTNMSLIKTAYCINDELDTFFFYNLSQIGKDLTLDELKEQGGVCSHSADYNYNRGKELGFNVEKVIFKYSNNTYHAITIISDYSGYCIEDMHNVNCVRLIS